jgi:hypothetical protein
MDEIEDSGATPTEKGTQQSDEHGPFRLGLQGLSESRAEQSTEERNLRFAVLFGVQTNTLADGVGCWLAQPTSVTSAPLRIDYGSRNQ